MSSRISSMPETLDWKKAYMAAILEKDRTRLHEVVCKATEQLSARLNELRAAGMFPCDEVEAIDDALYLLYALKNSVAYRDENGEWREVA
jgi:hypothetical protein